MWKRQEHSQLCQAVGLQRLTSGFNDNHLKQLVCRIREKERSLLDGTRRGIGFISSRGAFLFNKPPHCQAHSRPGFPEDLGMGLRTEMPLTHCCVPEGPLLAVGEQTWLSGRKACKARSHPSSAAMFNPWQAASYALWNTGSFPEQGLVLAQVTVVPRRELCF